MRIIDIRGQGKDVIPKGTIHKIEKQASYLIIRLDEGYFVELDSQDIGQIIDALMENQIIMSGSQVEP